MQVSWYNRDRVHNNLCSTKYWTYIVHLLYCNFPVPKTSYQWLWVVTAGRQTSALGTSWEVTVKTWRARDTWRAYSTPVRGDRKIAPVSYTHLDVYKRQSMKGPWLEKVSAPCRSVKWPREIVLSKKNSRLEIVMVVDWGGDGFWNRSTRP